jgi:transcriptional regulator with XRE-family HTH domain
VVDLRTQRLVKGLSQRELAYFAGCSHVTIGRLEKGDIDVSAALKARIAHALGVSVEKLWRPLDQDGSEAA